MKKEVQILGFKNNIRRLESELQKSKDDLKISVQFYKEFLDLQI